MKIKKDYKKLGNYCLNLFKQMINAGGSYLEKNNLNSNNPLIYKIIYFKIKKSMTFEIPMTKIEYNYWRTIKPKMTAQKIGDKIK